MDKILDYIGELLNIKSNNELTASKMVSELNQISNKTDFLNFLEDNYNDIDFKYLSGFQTFIEVTKRYKKQEYEKINKESIEKGSAKYLTLCKKVNDVRVPYNSYLNHHGKELNYESFQDANGNDAFTKEDISILSRVGSITTCLSLQRQASGSDELFNRLESDFRKRLSFENKSKDLQGGAKIKALANKVKRF